MIAPWLALAFLFGVAVGSFLTVVIVRFHSGRGIGGRSVCLSCHAEIAWYDLVPLASFVVLRRRCRACSALLSWHYPLVEFAAGLLFAGLFLRFFVTEGGALFSLGALFAALFFALVFMLLLVIVVYDIRHFIIPDPFVFAFSGMSLLALFLSFAPLAWRLPTLGEFLIGPALALPLAALWLVSRGLWMGLGDAKLALGIGWLLGVTGGISAVLWGFWIGAAYGSGLLLLRWVLRKASPGYLLRRIRRFTIRSEVPLAPFLILGLVLVFFFGLDVFVFLS